MDFRTWQTVFPSGITFRDGIDIILVSVFLYYFFLLIRGTRAVQILQGGGVLLLLSMAAYYGKLATIYWLLRAVLISIAVALPIVFHPELRRALGTLGRGGVTIHSLQRMNREEMARVVDAIAAAANDMAQASKGALIVIERDTGLDEYIERGVQLNADVSQKLLVSIFYPPSPLHDGAVIVHGNKIVAASCYLPLSENPPPTANLGTRHRAALGLSEETDAVIVVVSEQTGSISVALDGKLERGFTQETLKKKLVNNLVPPSQPPTRTGSVLKLPWR